MISEARIRDELKNVLDSTDFPGIGRKISGKVRDSYLLKDRRILITTDRVSDLVAIVSGAAQVLVSACPSITRMAFGGTFDLVAEDTAAVNALLRPTLRGVELDDATEDFLLQVNRPRPSKSVDGLRLNRLAKWAAMQWVLASVGFGPGMAGPAALTQLQERVLAAHREVDINTDALWQANLPAQSRVALLEELIETLRELLSAGVLP